MFSLPACAKRKGEQHILQHYHAACSGPQCLLVPDYLSGFVRAKSVFHGGHGIGDSEKSHTFVAWQNERKSAEKQEADCRLQKPSGDGRSTDNAG